MRRRHIYILVLSFAGQFSSCSYTQLKTFFQDCSEPVYVVAPNVQDSLCQLPETKFFYRYRTEIIASQYDPVRVLSTLYCLHGIRIAEAWYGTGNRDTSHAILRGITRHYQPFVVGMPTDTSDIWRYHFALDTLFDPARAFRSGTIHFVFKGFKQSGD